MIWDRRWPSATLRDRVLMICDEWENGIDRARLGRETKRPGVVLDRELDALVQQGWLVAEHPDDRPSRDSYYQINEEREGLLQLRQFWFIEYGFAPVPGDVLSDMWGAKPNLDVSVAARAIGDGPEHLSETSGRIARSLWIQAAQQRDRGLEIWGLMDKIHEDQWEARERARDVIHLPPDHRTPLPPRPRSGMVDEAATALALALACRRMAREDAGKSTQLLHTSAAGYERALAMSQVLHGGELALDSLRTPHSMRQAEVLRAGVRMAHAATELDNPRWRIDKPTVGFAGEVVLGYIHREMSEELEGITEEILALPEFASVLEVEEFREMLGDPPTTSLPEPSWKGTTRRVESRVELPPEEAQTEPIPLEAPADLRTGDLITEAGRRSLSAPVIVLCTDEEAGTVDLAMPGAHSSSVVPLNLLAYPDGLVVRRAVGDPLAK